MAVCLVPPEGKDTRVLSGERKEGGGGEEGKGEGLEGGGEEGKGEEGRVEKGWREERGRRGGRRREYVGEKGREDLRKVGKMKRSLDTS